MNPKTQAAAPAQPALEAAGPEASDAELANLIAPKPAKPAAARKPAAPAAEEEDPDLADEGDDLPDDPDPTGAEGDEDPAGEQAEPAAEGEQAEEGSEDPAEGEEGEEPADEQEQPAPEGLDAEDQAARKGFTPEQQKRFDKALFKQREKARQQIETLQAELEEARANPPPPLTPTQDNPLADVTSETDLDKRLAEQRNLRRWALTHPQGGTIKGEGGKDIEITAERVAEIVADTDEMLRDHIPARRKAIQENAQLERQAEADYPWLRQKNTSGTVAVNAMLARYGHMRLRDIPGIRGSLADLYIGQVTREMRKAQEAAAKGKGGNGAPPKAPPTPGGHRPPPKVAAPIKKVAQTSRKLEDTGADPDNAALAGLISRKH